MPKQNAEMTAAVNAHAAVKALHHHHHLVRINVRIHVMNAPNLHITLHKIHNTLHQIQITLHQLHIFQFHNHQDAVLVFIETATNNVFQILFQILYLQVAHQVSKVMDSEIVSHQQAQSHALLDSH